jgi:hypothetical protein
LRFGHHLLELEVHPALVVGGGSGALPSVPSAHHHRIFNSIDFGSSKGLDGEPVKPAFGFFYCEYTKMENFQKITELQLGYP